MPRLDIDYNLFFKETSKLNTLLSSISILPPFHQKLVAEIILLRLFSLLENAIASISARIACNANYLDGSYPVLLALGHSSASAISLFKNRGRRTPKQYLTWTIAREIKNNVKFVIHLSDDFYRTIDNNSSFISEIRNIRNRIAHNNDDSRKKYKEVVRYHYGAYLNRITPGHLLLTKRKTPCLLNQYITTTRIFISDLTKK